MARESSGQLRIVAVLIKTVRRKLLQILLYLRTCYQLDLRALAFMRIGVAAIIIIDLCIRAGDLQAHYTDEGVLPVSVLKQYGWQPFYWSVHTWSGGLTWQVVVFLIHGALALALLLGYQTRWLGFLLWLMEISLHNRNTFIGQSGDDLLRIVLFWGLFLPWDQCYALGPVRGVGRKQHFSIASIGYLLLIASVYFFTVNLKTSPEWRSEGTAIYYALSLDQIRWPMGTWLYQYPGLMKVLTHLVYYMEVLIPFLILLPARRQWPRLLAFGLLLMLHMGIGFTLYIGLFYLINMVTAIGLLPASVFNRFKIPYRFAPIRRYTKPAWLKQVTLAACVMVIALNLIANLSYCGWFTFTLRKELWHGIHILRLDQYWGMFSPGILKDDGWYVYRGFTAQEQPFDLYTNTPGVDFKKPEAVVDMYSSDRWRKFAENYQSGSRGYLHEPYCRWYLKRWNREHPENKMKRLEIFFMEEVSLPNYQTKPVTRRLCSACSDE